MEDIINFTFILIFFLSLFCIWISSKIQLAIVFLAIVAGLIFGPFMTSIYPTYAIMPKRLFGSFFHPVISITLGLLIFQFGQQCKSNQFSKRNIVRAVLYLGVIITSVTLIASWLLNFNYQTAILLGTLMGICDMTLTSQTVLPSYKLIQKADSSQIKQVFNITTVVSVILSILVYTTINKLQISSDLNDLLQLALFNLKILATCCLSIVIACGVLFFIKKYLKDSLFRTPVSYLVMFSSFVFSNFMMSHSGYIAVLLIGIISSRYKLFPTEQYSNINPTIRNISIYFILIVVSSSLKFEALQHSNQVFQFVFCMIIFVIPVSIFISFIKLKHSLANKLLRSTIQPYGIIIILLVSVFVLNSSARMPNLEIFISIILIIIPTHIIIQEFMKLLHESYLDYFK